MFKPLSFSAAAITTLVFAANVLAAIAPSPGEIQPIAIGQPVPDAALTRLDGSATSLSNELSGKKSVVIIFRGGWCPYCTKHLSALKDVLPELQKNYKIIAISPDTNESMEKAADKNAIMYELYRDVNFEAIERLGLAFQLDDDTLKKYKDYGISLVPHPQTGNFILPVPAVLITDDAGVVRYRYYNEDYKTRLDPEEILREASALP